MNLRPELEDKASTFAMGYKYGLKACEGNHRYQWRKLFCCIVVGSFIGASLALLLFIWFSTL